MSEHGDRWSKYEVAASPCTNISWPRELEES